MELKIHDGPVYELHRVFRLTHTDRPHADMDDDERSLDVAAEASFNQPELSRLSPPDTRR
jgi:hypothetical protein